MSDHTKEDRRRLRAELHAAVEQFIAGLGDDEHEIEPSLTSTLKLDAYKSRSQALHGDSEWYWRTTAAVATLSYLEHWAKRRVQQATKT